MMSGGAMGVGLNFEASYFLSSKSDGSDTPLDLPPVLKRVLALRRR